MKNLNNILITNNRYKAEYFGQMNLYIDISETKTIPTAAVYIDKTFKIRMIYNPDFINSLPESQKLFVLLHEDMHILMNHNSRIGKRDPKISNIAADYIVNKVIEEDIIGNIKSGLIEIPKEVLSIPPEYHGELIFEEVYDWIIEQKPEDQDKNQDGDSQDSESGNSNENSQNGDSSEGGSGGGSGEFKDDGSGDSEQLQKLKKMLGDENSTGETIDKHMESEVDADVAEQIFENVKNTLKNRGLQAGNITTIIDKLKKSKKNYLKEIKNSIASIKGLTKESTFKKMNRKGFEGMKGFKKIGKYFNLVLDTSGSMSGEWDKVLSVVFRNDITFKYIQCDTEIHDMGIIKSKKDIVKKKINGLGGTLLQPAIDHLNNKKDKSHPMIILTDSYCETLNFTGYKGKILVISIGGEIDFIGKKSIKQVIMDA